MFRSCRISILSSEYILWVRRSIASTTQGDSSISSECCRYKYTSTHQKKERSRASTILLRGATNQSTLFVRCVGCAAYAMHSKSLIASLLVSVLQVRDYLEERALNNDRWTLENFLPLFANARRTGNIWCSIENS